MAAPNSVPAFVCDLCPESETFRRDVDLKVHIDSVHLGQASFACDHCESRFSQRRRLTLHLNSEHLQLRPCSHIKIRARVRTTGALLTVHSSVKPFACDQCESRFKLKCYLKSHIRTVHSNERPYECEICAATFKLQRGLKVHKDSVHSEVRRSFACDQCDFTSAHRRSLWNHNLDIHPEHRKEDVKLNEQFSSSPTSLIRCVQSSSRHRAKCVICSRTFSCVRILKMHFKSVHSSEKPFVCDQCEYTSAYRSDLLKHSRNVHRRKDDAQLKTEVTEFQTSDTLSDRFSKRPRLESDICARPFKSTSLLKVHNESVQSAEKQCLLVSSAIRVEIKEEIPPEPDSVKDEIGRPFKCEICPKAFKLKCHLKSHRDSVHSTVHRFACEQCEYTAVRRWQMLRHIGTVHSNGEHHRINCILAIVLWHPQILQSVMNY